MLFFGYGSMMFLGELRHRCPTAQFVAVAKLPDHALKFTRYSKSRGCGVADAVEHRGDEIWGVVYEVENSDLIVLDECEGFRLDRSLEANSYVRRQRVVLRDGEPKDPILAAIYFANRQANPPKPNLDYKRLLIDGARHWGLPQSYQKMLEKIDTEG